MFRLRSAIGQNGAALDAEHAVCEAILERQVIQRKVATLMIDDLGYAIAVDDDGADLSDPG